MGHNKYVACANCGSEDAKVMVHNEGKYGCATYFQCPDCDV